jgi:hypothetical protein
MDNHLCFEMDKWIFDVKKVTCLGF